MNELHGIKALRRTSHQPEAEAEAEGITGKTVIKAISEELRELLVEIDECHAEGRPIIHAICAAHMACNILDRMCGLDPSRLTDL